MRRRWPAALALALSLPPAAPAAAQLEEALRRLPDDPPVDHVVAAALEASGPSTRRLHALARRARRRGWAPELRLEARRGQGWDLSSLQSADALDRQNVSRDDELTLAGRLVFALDRVVFAPEEVALAREARAALAERRALVARVVALYFERRRLLLEEALGAAPTAASRLRVAAIEAELEALAARPLFAR